MTPLQIASNAAGIVPGLSLDQEVRLLIIGIGLIVALAVDRLLVWRIVRSISRWMRRVPLLGVLVEKDVSASRWFEGLLDLLFVTIAVFVSLAVVDVELAPVTRWARELGLGTFDWLRTSGVRIALIVVLAYLVNRTARAVVQPLIQGGITRGKAGVEFDEAAKRAVALGQVAGHVLRAVIFIVSVFMILSELKVNIGPLLAGVGVVGIAVGFGAQSFVRDIISGSFVIAEDQYRVGDVASVGGKTGFVEGVNLRRTVLRDLDGVVHYIPNSEITSASNFTKSFSRVNLDIGVAYKEDLDHVIRVLNRVGAELSRDGYFGPLIIEPPRVLRVNSFGDSGIDLKILGVTKPIRQWEVMGELRRRIKREFDREGIEIPFPHRTIYWGVDSHPSVPQAALEQMQSSGRVASGGEGESLDRFMSDPWADEVEERQREEDEHGRVDLIANRGTVRDLLLASPPSALFVDIDGTLARINPNPAAVAITPAVRQALDAISKKIAVVALTGRDVNAAHGIIGLGSITYVGNHGAEWREKGSTTVLPEVQRYVRPMHEIAALGKRRLGSIDGVIIEDKGPSISFHYRAALDPIAARSAILEFLDTVSESRGMDRREGKMVVELRPPVDVNKGAALRRFVDRRAIKSALVLGDDLTDVDSFSTLRELRDRGTLAGATVAVLSANTPQELIDLADYRLADTEATELYLTWLAEELSHL